MDFNKIDNIQHKHRDGVFGAAANTNDLGEIFDVMDADGDGAICADDLAQVHLILEAFSNEILRATAGVGRGYGNDLAGKNVLGKDRFLQVMQKMGMKHSPADIEEMIKAAGSDCGKVDREQFLKMVSTG